MKKIYTILIALFSVFSFVGNGFAQNPQLYGMSYGGGANSCGTIFKMNSDGSGFQTVYSFDTLTGRSPYGTLMQATNGKLYGMTNQGGKYELGALFSFDITANVFKDVYDFNDTNGAFAYGNLLEATNGKLYGMTSQGGANSRGVIFSFNPTDSLLTKLVDLSDSLGSIPKGSLMQADDGDIYGMTSGGGTNSDGVLFRFNLLNNHYSKQVNFNLTNGAFPFGSLTKGTNGILYGSTRSGGANSAGVIFSFNTSDSSYSKLFDLAGGNEQTPAGSITLAANGSLYGLTMQGGSNSIGSVYKFNVADTIYREEAAFDSINGIPSFFNTLMQSSNNKLYGTTVHGGTNNDGVIFSFNPADSSYTKLVDFSDTTGKYPNGTLLELNSITGIPMSGEQMNISIYPNPVKSSLNIYCNSVNNYNITIYITNIAGEVIKTEKRPFHSTLDVSSLSAGIYFIKITSSKDETQRWIGKFIKE